MVAGSSPARRTRRTGKLKIMATIEKFLDLIDKANDRLGCSNGSAWYRGQSDSWDLAPSLMRFYAGHGIEVKEGEAADPREEGFFNEFLFRCPELTLRNISSWELLALMQHYGTPTRLLDWTENLFVAVYFAIAKFINGSLLGDAQPCVYIVNPYKLSKHAIATSDPGLPIVNRNDGLRLVEITTLGTLDYADSFLVKGKWWFRSPLPIASPWQNERIFAQQGFFTVHGLDLAPLNRQPKVSRYVKRVAIAAEVIPEFERMFRAMNLNHYTLFRDYESLSRQLKKKFAKNVDR